MMRSLFGLNGRQYQTGAIAYVLDISNLKPRTQLLSTLLNRGELERASRFRTEQDRFRFIATHGLARLVVRSALRGSAEQFTLSFEFGAAPAIHHPMYEGISISISHTELVCAVGLTIDGEIGVDVEPWRSAVELLRMQRAVLTDNEAARLCSIGERNRPDGIVRLWTAKEAVYKAGRPTDRGFDPKELCMAGVLSGSASGSAADRTRFQFVNAWNCCACVAYRGSSPETIVSDLTDLDWGQFGL